MNRGVPQLQRLYVLYNPRSGSSKGVMELLQQPAGQQLLNEFKQRNPHVELETIASKKTFPAVEAFYKNDSFQSVSLRYATTPRAVVSQFQILADQSGRRLSGLKKWPFARGQTESVQGRWNVQFNLKPDAEQLKPLQKKQTHLVGLAPAPDAAPVAK